MAGQPVSWDEVIPVLLACLHHQGVQVTYADLEQLSADAWERLEALAADQRVRPLLYHRLKAHALDRAVPPALWQRLYNAYRLNALRNLRLYAELRQIAAALQSHHIAMIALKGMYLAETVYGNIALREMNDIDVLVHREHLAPAVEAVACHGYRPIHPFHIAIDTDLNHHLTPFVKTDVVSIEIHWNLTKPHRFYTIDPDELWPRVVPVIVGNVTLWGLSPEDLLLHLCLHTSYQHQFAFGLRPSCDIAATIHHFAGQLDWDVFCQRSLVWHWARGSYLALRLARDLVGAEVPEPVLAVLKPADLEEHIVQTARTQLFTAKDFAHTMNDKWVVLWGLSSSLGKVRLLWQRLFLPWRFMAARYGLSPHSCLLPFYYLVRAKELLLRHGGIATQLLRAEEQTISLATRKHMLQRWLSVP